MEVKIEALNELIYRKVKFSILKACVIFNTDGKFHTAL